MQRNPYTLPIKYTLIYRLLLTDLKKEIDVIDAHAALYDVLHLHAVSRTFERGF